MSQPSDLDVRIVALSREYESTIASLSGRAATLASELASAEMRLQTAQAQMNKSKPKTPRE